MHCRLSLYFATGRPTHSLVMAVPRRAKSVRNFARAVWHRLSAEWKASLDQNLTFDYVSWCESNVSLEQYASSHKRVKDTETLYCRVFLCVRATVCCKVSSSLLVAG